MTVEDARAAADIGASAVIVSNHGGRQMEGVPATIEALPAIAEALGDRLEVLMDGGVRRGTHVLKALALGAKAVTIGRPYIYGVTAGGQPGVAKVLSIFRDELTRDCQLLCAASLAEVGPELIRLPPRPTMDGLSAAGLGDRGRRRVEYVGCEAILTKLGSTHAAPHSASFGAPVGARRESLRVSAVITSTTAGWPSRVAWIARINAGLSPASSVTFSAWQPSAAATAA